MSYFPETTLPLTRGMLRAKAARMQLHNTPNACAMRPGHNQKEERDDVDWKLIFRLSLFGLAMAIATVFAIPSNIEPAFWLVISCYALF